MTNDASTPKDRRDEPDLWALPKLTRVRSVRVRYLRPRRRLLEGKPVEVSEGVELQVQTDGEIPIRALSPALFIGDAEVAENRTDPDGTTHRFLVDDEAKLADGAEITLGWVGHPPAGGSRTAAKAKFRYSAPTETIDEPPPAR